MVRVCLHALQGTGIVGILLRIRCVDLVYTRIPTVIRMKANFSKAIHMVRESITTFVVVIMMVIGFTEKRKELAT